MFFPDVILNWVLISMACLVYIFTLFFSKTVVCMGSSFVPIYMLSNDLDIMVEGINYMLIRTYFSGSQIKTGSILIWDFCISANIAKIMYKVTIKYKVLTVSWQSIVLKFDYDM